MTFYGGVSCMSHKRSGMPCTHAPNRGERTCRMHGSNAASHAKAARTLAAQDLAKAVVLFGARRDVAPESALLELVQWTAGEVDVLRGIVSGLDSGELFWGVARERTGGAAVEGETGRVGSPEVTREAKPHVAYVMLASASDRLAAYCVAAARMNIDERVVRLSEAQGIAAVAVLRSVLVAMFEVVLGVLVEAGVSGPALVDGLTQAWGEALASIVPAAFRAQIQAGCGAT